VRGGPHNPWSGPDQSQVPRNIFSINNSRRDVEDGNGIPRRDLSFTFLAFQIENCVTGEPTVI